MFNLESDLTCFSNTARVKAAFTKTTTKPYAYSVKSNINACALETFNLMQSHLKETVMPKHKKRNLLIRIIMEKILSSSQKQLVIYLII